MKNILLFASVLVLMHCLPHHASYAQETAPTRPTRFGVRGGLNLSNLDIQNVSASNAILGWNLGVFLKLPLTNSISIQPEAYYSTKGSEVTYNNNTFAAGTARYNLNYIEIPLLLVFNLLEIVNIHVGPYAAYLLSGTVKNVGSVSAFNFENNITPDDYNRWDAGVAVGAGVDLGALSVGARYSLGLTTIGKERLFLGNPYTFPNAKNSVLSLYVSFALN